MEHVVINILLRRISLGKTSIYYQLGLLLSFVKPVYQNKFVSLFLVCVSWGDGRAN